MMNDITIQIRSVTEFTLSELRKKFPGKEFDLIVRDFAPSIHIRMRKTQLSEMLKNTSKVLSLRNSVWTLPVRRELCITLMAEE